MAAVALRVAIGCEFHLRADQPTAAVMMVEPHSREQAIVDQQWSALTDHEGSRLPSAIHVDTYGNRARRFVLPVGRTVIRFAATGTDDGLIDPWSPQAPEPAPAEVPNEVLAFLLPSRYCESDRLATDAAALFGKRPRGWQRVQDVIDWTHTSIRFAYGSTSTTTSAFDVIRLGHGVCRDYAHVAIAMCRALNIPARYAFGYLPDIAVPANPDPMDFCAWIEVFLDGAWWTFDPRNNERRIGRVVIGRGRDAADVAMLTTFAFVHLDSMTVTATATAIR